MANEILLSGGLSVSKGGASASLHKTLNVTLTGTRFLHNVQSVGTSEEALALGEVVTGGWLIAINRDATNYVELKVATGGSIFAKLKAGELCLLRLGSAAAAPFAIANTAACLLEYIILPD